MQYILTKEEYENLDEIKNYNNLLESVTAASIHIVKAVCLLDGSPMSYCDKCPIAHLQVKEKYSSSDFCLKTKYFSK